MNRQVSENGSALFEVSCKVILLNRDKTKIVLVDRENGMSSLPGGHLEFDESLEAAALREMSEELGIDYAGELKKGSFTLYGTGEKVVVSFVGELDENVELPEIYDEGEESLGGQWYAVDDALTGETNRYMVKEYQDLVEKAIGRKK